MSEKKCSGSGMTVMLAWLPDGNGYPGAAICPCCSLGVCVLKKSVRNAKSVSGIEGKSGQLRVHYPPDAEGPTS